MTTTLSDIMGNMLQYPPTITPDEVTGTYLGYWDDHEWWYTVNEVYTSYIEEWTRHEMNPAGWDNYLVVKRKGVLDNKKDDLTEFGEALHRAKLLGLL